jgi:hypothetical protein
MTEAPPSSAASKQAWLTTQRRLQAEAAAICHDLEPVWGLGKAPVVATRSAAGPDWLFEIKRHWSDLSAGSTDERAQIEGRVSKARSAIRAALALLTRVLSAPEAVHGVPAAQRASDVRAFQERSARADAALAAVKDFGRHRYGVLAAEESSLDEVLEVVRCGDAPSWRYSSCAGPLALLPPPPCRRPLVQAEVQREMPLQHCSLRSKLTCTPLRPQRHLRRALRVEEAERTALEVPGGPGRLLLVVRSASLPRRLRQPLLSNPELALAPTAQLPVRGLSRLPQLKVAAVSSTLLPLQRLLPGWLQPRRCRRRHTLALVRD